MTDTEGKHVAILLATKDGNRFLSGQLQSFDRQTHSNWSLHVSDDGSSDTTRATINEFSQDRAQTVTLRDGPQRGFCRNFMSLAGDRSLVANFFAYSDQDDIWYADKLERALSYLRKVPQEMPAVYCSRTELVNEEGRHVGFSPLFTRPPSFQNALIQNIGGGNTMVFNAATKRLLEASSDIELVSHDWWTYQIVSACGGLVFYDPQPSLAYRQHEGNILGSNVSVEARLFRMRMMISGKFKAWGDTNVNALQHLRRHLTPASSLTLDNFIAARDAKSLRDRLFYLRRSGVFRQSVLANLGFVIAAVLGKV